jgi:hypothetical protein
MTLGTINKKTAGLVGTLVLAASYSVYTNFFENSPGSSSPPPGAASQRNSELNSAVTPVNAPAAQSRQPRPLANRNSRGDEFHPVLRKKNARPDEQQINPNEIDPTLHFELLAKVQEMKLEGGQRNLFQFGASPVEAKPLAGPEPVIAMGKPFIYPQPDRPKPPEPPKVEPPPPPPSFKYYGLATKRIDNKRTAFFLDGEDIILATEGMTVKTRWRVVRIGADSVMLEDMQTKRQQPLGLSEDAGGSS